MLHRHTQVFTIYQIWHDPEASFLNDFSRLPEKLAPMLVLELTLFVPRHEVGAYAIKKKLETGELKYFGHAASM
jgi:hypothetical protein